MIEIAVRIKKGQVEIFKDWNVRFDKATLSASPYNYSFITVPKDILDNITAEDFAGCEFSFDKYCQRIDEQEKNKLRELRKKNCFSVINRGQLWYSKLNEQQLEELNLWYENWLNITTSYVVPALPQWLNVA